MRKLVDETPGREYIFMDVEADGSAQKVVIELFTEYAPKTCENFKKLCVGGYTNKEGH